MDARFMEPTTAGRLKLVLCVVVGAAILAVELWWGLFMAFVRGAPMCEQLPRFEASACGC
jgi:hypothetical protein